jgi:cell wall-associated NlpC family hydrolase
VKDWRESYASEDAARAAVAREARSWIGTPWAHAHCLKGHGVDCAMLLLAVYTVTGLVDPIDPRPYDRQWYMHRDEPAFMKIVHDCGGHPVDVPSVGDIAMYKFGRHPAHGAIIVDEHYMVHAYSPAEAVILDVRHAMPDHFHCYMSLF